MYRGLPKKQQQILATAEDLFQRFGIRRVTVEEICSTAKVSKMTFYKYFKNKVELVRFFLNSWVEDGMKQFEEVRRSPLPFPQKLARILELKEESTRKVSHQFALDYLNGIPELKAFFREKYDKSIALFIDFIREAQQKGEVRSDMKVEFFLAMITAVKQLIEDKDLVSLYDNYNDFIMEVNNFLFYGLLPRSADNMDISGKASP